MVPQDGLLKWLLDQDKCSHVLDVSRTFHGGFLTKSYGPSF